MDSITIRRKFLDFFASKGHQIVPSAPLVLKNDPTLLFTNSGMVQFKDNFLGNAIPRYKRVADTQKCLRVSGKHNDLEDVGLDTYHHTMFEMLGNWSFGDYFKKEAIAWAWELLTEVYKLPKDRLYASVFGGDKDDNMGVDTEAESLWTQYLPKDHIIYGNKKDNFWEMADVGPCGPCSEIHIDLRDDPNDKRSGASLVNADHPQVVEIWNLVFMEYERFWNKEGAQAELNKFTLEFKGDDKTKGKEREKLRSSLTSLKFLPNKNVDTGMGFERLCMAIQRKTSNYDTDVFSPLIEFIATHANIKYHGKLDNKQDIAIRVIADHIRAVSFAISDGQLPSNSGAGYVIRRILRRAVRYAYSSLGFTEPFIHRLVPLLALQMKDAFPELHQQQDYVERVVQEEEVSFLRTLEKGLKKIEALNEITAEQAFELYDTYGFPFDLTSLIAREKGWTVDEKGFNDEMAKQKSRSRVDAAKETGDWVIVGDDVKTEFVGYDFFETQANLVKYRKIKQKNKELYQFVFDKTPFYAESGGQVGDTGTATIDGTALKITDTKKENELIIHYAESLPKTLDGVWSLKIDNVKRRSSMNNHSATHLLHAALRNVLGKHVEQKGSLVNDNILRFDFSHFTAMTPEEIAKVESIVNQKIMENIALDEKRNVPIDKAKTLGAMALFGEKYGEFVRVITFDPKFSVELCGGTHVAATGNIGSFKILSESSVAAGVRRIEAVTGEGALSYFRGQLALLDEVKTLLKNPKDVAASLQSLVEEKHALEKKLEALNAEKAVHIFNNLQEKIHNDAIIERVSVPNADVLKNISFNLRNKYPNLFMVLAADIEGKPQISVMLGEQAQKKFNAVDIIKTLAKEIEGGGGGQPFYATAGGKKLEGLSAVITKAKELVN